MFPPNMRKKWTYSGAFFSSLTPGSLPKSLTSVMGLDDEKGRQELRPRGPSSMLPLSSVIKDVFDKFEHEFLAPNLPVCKYIKRPPLQSGTKWDSLVMRRKYRS